MVGGLLRGAPRWAACAALVALNAAMLGSGLAAYAAIGAHEAVHCWAGQVASGNTGECHVTVLHPSQWALEPAGVAWQRIEGDAGMPWWEHPLCYAATAAVLLLLLLPAWRLALRSINRPMEGQGRTGKEGETR